MHYGETTKRSETDSGESRRRDANAAEVIHARQTPFRARVLGSVWASGLRLLTASWRVEIEGLETLDDLVTRGRPHLVAFWHRKYVALCTLLPNRQACVFTSRSRRGNVISELCRRFGFVDVQIPDRAGERALDLMRQSLPPFCEAGIAVDGPLGPYHVVKRGAVQLASQLGWLIVPASVASRSHYMLARRWDRLEIPKPFTRVSLILGEPFTVPPNLSAGELHRWTQRLHDILEEDECVAQRKVGSTMAERA